MAAQKDSKRYQEGKLKKNGGDKKLKFFSLINQLISYRLRKLCKIQKKLFRGVLRNSCSENVDKFQGTRLWWSTKLVNCWLSFPNFINIGPRHGCFPKNFLEHVFFNINFLEQLLHISFLDGCFSVMYDNC